MNKYLEETDGIQVSDELIAQKINKLFPNGVSNVSEALSVIFNDLQNNFKNKNFSGFTDAITALKLGEASCNGKSRLFIALLRKLNIPSRLVGGLVLKTTEKRTSHQWIEAYVDGVWIPFDTLNNKYMEHPSNYLTLYYGDQNLFSHTVNINFDYKFKIQKKLITEIDSNKITNSSLTFNDFFTAFEKVGISQNFLKIVLMIPIGALIIVIFRNVIGIETFGIFLPALIATAARETGLLWGLAGFMIIIFATAIIRKLLDWLGLLYSPKMAIMLIVVVLGLLSLTLIGIQYDLLDLANMSLFPIAILAITAERFSTIQEEEGMLKALTLSFTTIIVITAAYVVMSSEFIQSAFIIFPELLLMVIVLNLWIGKWVGLRLSEFIRFRKLIFAKENKND